LAIGVERHIMAAPTADTMHQRGATLALRGVVVATLAAVSVCEAQPPSLDVILDRLGAYLLDYETKVVQLAAAEEYEQWIKRRPGWGQETVAKRKFKSTIFLVALPDGHLWYGFRDVSHVDGKALPPRVRPMTQLLGEGSVAAYNEALAIMRENARFNIGGVYRTLNLPLQALEMLHPQNRERFTFSSGGEGRLRGARAFRIAFAERGGPTVVSDGFGGDLLSRGQVWVEMASGAVLRTELQFGGTAERFLKESLLTVDYQRDQRLQMLVPAEMEETYGFDIEVLHGRASYRNYRRFETGGRLVTPN
jgi:hypothetical protein